ncbi:MAG: hypothetical protein IJU50_05645 [Lachnospiraceae bacterium]|nr:hypothetical protein [Lachnospiraceae bacterium]
MKNKKIIFASVAIQCFLAFLPLLLMPFQKPLDFTLLPEIIEERDVLSEALDLPAGIYAVQVDYEAETDGGVFSWEYDEEKTDYHSFHGDSFDLKNDKTTYNFHIYLDAAAYDLRARFKYGKQEGDMRPQLIRIVTSKLTYFRTSLRIFGFFIILNLVLFYRHWMWEKDATTKIIPLALLVIAFFSSLLLFKYGSSGGLDLLSHLYRIDGLKNGLLSGQFPVRVQPGWLNGYGYAIGMFYGDILLLPFALLRLMGITLTTAYTLYVFSINLLTAILAYVSFKGISKDPIIGLTCSAVYTLGQYRLIDIYFRAAMGEYSAMAFFPLILYGFYLLLTSEARKDSRGIWCLVFGFSGILHTHTLSCEIVFLYATMGCLMFAKKLLKEKERLLAIGKAALLTIVINLWYLVPFMDFYLRDKFFVNDGSRDGFTIQYIGTELQRIFAPAYFGMTEDLPATLGGTLTLALFAGIGWALLASKQQKANAQVKGICRMLLLGVLSLWMSTDLFPYDALRACPPVYKTLTMIQFPWRFLGMTCVLMTFVLAGLLAELKHYCLTTNSFGMTKQKSPSVSRKQETSAGNTESISITSVFPKTYVYPLLLGTVLMLGVFQGIEYQIYEDVHADMHHYYSDLIGIDSFAQNAGEYIPSGSDWAYFNRPYVYNLDGKVYVPDFELGNGYVRAQAISQQETGTQEEPGIVCVPLLFYRGYEAKDLETGARLGISKDWNNVLTVEIPADYSGTFEVRYKGLWYWRISDLISLVCVVGLVGWKNRTLWKR